VNKPSTRAVLGHLLTIGGKAVDVLESKVTTAVRLKAERGVLSILPSSKPGHVQIRALK